MADQIVFFQRKDHIREKSRHVVSVKFKTRSTAALTIPTNVYYRLDNLTTGGVVLDWTSVSTDDEMDITVTPTQNTMTDQGNREERMQLTVAADYGLSTQFIDSTSYDIENVQGVT